MKMEFVIRLFTQKKDKRVREKEQLKIEHKNHPAMVEKILETSAEKKIGLDELRDIIGVK